MTPLGIYVHVPFCVRRCPYCGFYSDAVGTGGYEDRIKEYLRHLGEELRFRKEQRDFPYFVDSVYFGGGTPSLADPGLIGDLIDEIAALYPVTEDCEISMEANPGTLDRKRLEAYREAGVSRLSLGLQSLDDGVLRTLGRIHTADDFVHSFDDARSAGFDNISADLMFGVPGQTEKIWEDTVERLASMLPEHISFYSLQIEEGTPFYTEYKMGDMEPVPDEEDRAMYHRCLEILRSRGYGQYEISNAALPGKECRHNLKYWTFGDYLGIGASASSFVDGVRKTDPGAGYDDFARKGFPDSLLAEDHRNSFFDSCVDYMITGLRLTEGIDERDFAKRFGKSIDEVFPRAEEELSEFKKSGRVVRERGRLRITVSGMDVANRIMQIFV